MATATEGATRFAYEWTDAPRTATVFAIFTTVAVVGWMVSTMLTAIHLFALPAVPADEPVAGSIEVITSQWAYVFGVPLASLGALYYLLTIALALWWFDTRHPLVIKLLTPVTATGVAFSAYFVYLQLVVIEAICPFCMVSAAATVTLLSLELLVLTRSDTPAMGTLVADARGVLDATTVAVIAVPVLMGLATIAGLFLIPQLPLPETVPFV
mgnify:FL=1